MPHTMLQAFGVALRPIIKIMLKNGVDVSQFTSLARSVYVSVAQDEEFALKAADGKNRKITHSRIAMLTGINRKEVKQLVERGSITPRRTTENRAVRVLTGWIENERYHDKKGEPKPLPYGQQTTQAGKKAGKEAGSEANFEELVNEYSADTTVRVILDELVHVGSVRLDDDGRVHLIEKGYIPIYNHEEMIAVGSRAIADLAVCVDHNIHRPKDSPPRLQMSVRYDDVPEQGAAYYRAMLRNDAEEFLVQQNKNLSSFDRSKNPDAMGSGKYTVGVGIYYFEEPTVE